MYTVMYQCTCHPLEIQYDAYDVMSRVMAIGHKPMMITLPARSGHTMVVRGP